MEKLQMLKYAIRKDTQLNFTEGMSWAEEIVEIEALQKDVVPTDTQSYLKIVGVEEDDDDDDWKDEEDLEESGGDETDLEVEEGEEDEEDEEDEEEGEDDIY
jgi:hypothetical protein